MWKTRKTTDIFHFSLDRPFCSKQRENTQYTTLKEVGIRGFKAPHVDVNLNLNLNATTRNIFAVYQSHTRSGNTQVKHGSRLLALGTHPSLVIHWSLASFTIEWCCFVKKPNQNTQTLSERTSRSIPTTIHCNPKWWPHMRDNTGDHLVSLAENHYSLRKEKLNPFEMAFIFIVPLSSSSIRLPHPTSQIL